MVRVSAAKLALVALVVVARPATAAVYDFTVELPISLGVNGRGEAPKERLTFSVDTTLAVIDTYNTIFPNSTAFDAVPVTIFQYATATAPATTTTISYLIGVGKSELDILEPAVPNVQIFTLYDGSSSLISSGTGTNIVFDTGILLPADNVGFASYLNQSGTLLITSPLASSVPEPSSWSVVGACLLMLAGFGRVQLHEVLRSAGTRLVASATPSRDLCRFNP